MSLSGSFMRAYEYGSAAMANYFEMRFHGLPNGIGTNSGMLNNSITGEDIAAYEKTEGVKRYQGLVEGEIAYRAKNITIPSTGVTTTDIEFMGIKIKVPIAKVDTAYEFSTDFRIDRYWTLYSDLVRWRNKLVEPATGRFGMDILTVGLSKLTDTRCSMVEVTACTPNKNGYGDVPFRPVVWRFAQAFPFKLGEIAFNYENGNTPVTVNVSFGFLNMQEHFADELRGVK